MKEEIKREVLGNCKITEVNEHGVIFRIEPKDDKAKEQLNKIFGLDNPKSVSFEMKGGSR